MANQVALPSKSSIPDSSTTADDATISPIVSPIQELQSVFSTILLLEKDRPEPEPTPIYPRWTGSFALLDFPRELRDIIYFHTLYRQEGLKWRRGHVRRGQHPYRYRQVSVWPTGDSDAISLFLTCRQVHEEATSVFYACNSISVERQGAHGRRRANPGLGGILRTFPGSTASLIRSVKLLYHSYENSPYEDSFGPGSSWHVIIRDAWLAKETFPLLQEFAVSWQCSQYCFSERENMFLENKSEEDKINMFLRFFRFHSERIGLRPPPWLRIKFSPWCRFMIENQRSWDTAYRLFMDEGREYPQVAEAGLEMSGKTWIDETWNDGKRQR